MQIEQWDNSILISLAANEGLIIRKGVISVRHPDMTESSSTMIAARAALLDGTVEVQWLEQGDGGSKTDAG